VLEEQSFERVGGTQRVSVDVRVIAATNRDLQALVVAQQFREDLFYRLSVLHEEVPPLRARPTDIGPLAQHFLEKLSASASRRILGFTEDALEALTAYAWPGNVRELRNAVERAIVLGDGEWVMAHDLPDCIATPRRQAPGPRALGTASEDARPQSLKELEREGIVRALTATAGNKARAAQILESDRSTLYKKIRDYNIDV